MNAERSPDPGRLGRPSLLGGNSESASLRIRRLRLMKTRRPGFGLALIGAMLITGCSAGSAPGKGAASSDTASSQVVVQASCETAAQGDVTEVAGGLKAPASGLQDAYTVATTKTETQDGNGVSRILAANIEGATKRPAIGLWSLGDGSIDAINTVAQQYSEWGAAAQPGSPALATRARVAAFPETNRAAGCSEVAALKPARSGPSASIGANRCGFPPAPDVIYWFVMSGGSASAQLLGAYDLANCTRTSDQSQVDKTSPQGPGDCTIVASVAANPGYNVDASPAPRPRGILAESGPAC